MITSTSIYSSVKPRSLQELIAEKISISQTADPSKKDDPRTSAGGKKPANDMDA